MTTSDILHFLQHDIHSAVFATLDHDGLPVTCVIDIMMADDKGLYFLTAKGKSFYERLAVNPNISLTGMKGEDTMSSQSVTVRGKVRELGSELLPKLFELNPYMADIYPDEKSRTALTVFQIYEGTGEFFDLSSKPIYRQSFTYGGGVQADTGYYVTDACTGCKLCYSVCPQRCIDISAIPVVIQSEHCLHCGKCSEICPAGAVIKRGA